MSELKMLATGVLAALAITAAPTVASAQDVPQDEVSHGADIDGDGADEEAEGGDGTLPAPKSDDDPDPEVAQPAVPPSGLVKQAGVGGQTAYGRAGVLELGGSAGFSAASDMTHVSFSPTVGYFVADNLQLTGILGASYVSAGDADGTMFRALVEPSYHLPFNKRTFAFLGLGAGVAHVDGPGTGFALAPRLGANMLVGRSGILTPSISYQYTTHDTIETTGDMELLAVSSAVQANIGYTVMW